MKSVLTILLLVFASKCLIAQDYITREVISRVFNIRYGAGSGTSFVILYKNENYIVTARHMFPGLQHHDKLTFQRSVDNTWQDIRAELLVDSNKEVDIAVLKILEPHTVVKALSIEFVGMTLSDQGLFLGYPYGYQNASGKLNSGFPFPLVKKALYSGNLEIKGVQYILFDAMNNPGFSGGPIVFKDRHNPADSSWHLIGVVSAYHQQKDTLHTPSIDYEYFENSGIMIGVQSTHIQKILERN